MTRVMKTTTFSNKLETVRKVSVLKLSSIVMNTDYRIQFLKATKDDLYISITFCRFYPDIIK
jgi:hypothetical protein